MQGKVSRVDRDGRFGFIESDGREYYFQEQGLDGHSFDEVSPGSVVEFRIDEQSPLDAENPTAIEVRLSAANR